MSLLPGGERGPPLLQVSFAVVVIWLGWQGFVNVLRYQAVSGNIVSLGAELNHGGEEDYRRELESALKFDSEVFRPEDIQIVFDEAKDQYRVEVQSRWTLDLAWWHFEVPTTHRTKVGRSKILNHRG